jgi:hypothetical protein
MSTRLLFVFLWLTLPGLTLAQTTGLLRGTVRMADGKPLPYAALTAKATDRPATGTMANADGEYALKLPLGRYDLTFQYLGFQTRQQAVEIGADPVLLDVTLAEQVVRLAEVNVKKGSEDPAVSIMRRAIAKARFHQLQVLSFTARVYQKVAFTVTKLPLQGLYREQLKKAELESNFKVGVPILAESVSEVRFSQPNNYRRRVLAVRNSLPAQAEGMNPGAYFLSSFYNPEVIGAVSPLSPKAFGYYTFSYQGTFRESGPNGTSIEISKIGVTPRGFGEGVFRGTIFIIEDTWAIHSLQLETRNDIGAAIAIRQVCAPVRGVWMPTNQRYNFDGTYLGIGGSGQFVLSQTFSQFQVNPAFVEDVTVLDEKFNKPAVTLSNKVIAGQKFDEVVAKQKEFSTKNLRQLVREYEKQQYKARKQNNEDVAVTRTDSISIDSTARRANPAIWDSLRTVPLSMAEARSYGRADSLATVRIVIARGDSLSGKSRTARRDTTNRRFRMGQLLWGHTWPLTPEASLRSDDILTNLRYNTVEGTTVEAGLRYGYFTNKTKDTEFSLRANGRYGFGWRQFIGYGTAGYRHKTTDLSLSGGRDVVQYNPDRPVSTLLNTVATTLFGQNLMKLYRKDYFLNLTVTAKPLDGRITLTGSVDLAQRSELPNYRDDLTPVLGWFGNRFTPNRPQNAEDRGPTDAGTVMPIHRALTLNLLAEGQLGQTRYSLRNGQRRNVRTTGPRWLLNYRRGFADADYDFVQAQVRHSLPTGIRSRLDLAVRGGAFLTANKLYLPDFKHFAGNEFFFMQGDPLTQFRLLPYYQYSTKSRFLEAHALIEFRQFLLTQVVYARLLGLKEDLFVHYLATPASRNYTEVGYALDGLVPGFLPFFRLEVIGQFQDWQYRGLGFRVGTTLRFGR